MGQKLFSKCHSEFLIDVIRLEFAKLFNWIQMNMVFKSSRPTKFYKIGFLEKIRRIHMETTEIYNSNKKRLQCWCFPVNLAKFLRTFRYRTPSASTSGFFLFALLFFANRNQVSRSQVFSCEFCEFFKKLIENRFFLFFNMFYQGFQKWWISWTLHLENFKA